jgi:hypothetical protein
MERASQRREFRSWGLGSPLLGRTPAVAKELVILATVIVVAAVVLEPIGSLPGAAPPPTTR